MFECLDIHGVRTSIHVIFDSDLESENDKTGTDLTTIF